MGGDERESESSGDHADEWRARIECHHPKMTADSGAVAGMRVARKISTPPENKGTIRAQGPKNQTKIRCWRELKSADYQRDRADWIRTSDLLNPIQAHYQAVLRPDFISIRRPGSG